MPIEILYDRMKTAVTGEDDEGHIVYNRSLLALAKHYGFLPRACRPVPGKDEGQGRAAVQLHPPGLLPRRAHSAISTTSTASSPTGSTRSPTSACTARRSGSSSEAFAAEQPDLQPLPAAPFDALLKLERRVSHDGLVSIGGNYYSVPDRTRRIVEVHQLPDIIRILDGGRLVATHPVLDGRRQYRVDPAHRQGGAARALRHGDVGSVIIGRRGDHVARRSLAFYQAIGEHLAGGIGGRS